MQGTQSLVRLITETLVALIFVWVLADLASPTLRSADHAEFQSVVRDLGIAHPPGYPLYTLTAHTFGRLVTQPGPRRLLRGPETDGFLARPHLPGGGDQAGSDVSASPTPTAAYADGWTWATNLYSLVLALATVLVVASAASHLTHAPGAGFLAGFVLFGAPTFLAQATVANIRMPTALLAALVCHAAISVLGAGLRLRPARAAWLGLVATAAVTHHISLAFLAVPVLTAVALQAGRRAIEPRVLGAGLTGAALGLLPLVYLPLRDAAGALQAPGGLTSVAGLLHHATAAGFRGDMLAFTERADLADRLPVLWAILRWQFGVAGLAIVAAGWLWILWRKPLAGLALGTAAGLSTAAGLTYRAPQTVEYLMPVYVMASICAGGLPGWIATRNGAGSGRRLAAGLVAVAAALAVTAPRFGSVSGVTEVNAAQTPMVGLMARGCALGSDDTGRAGNEFQTFLSAWHYAPALDYVRRREGRGPTVVYVHPEGAEPIATTWRRRLDDAALPSLLTNRYAELGGTIWPVPHVPFFATEPVVCGGDRALPAPRDYTVFGDRLALYGLDVDQPVPGEVSVAVGFGLLPAIDPAGLGEPASQLTEPAFGDDEPLAVFAQLVDPLSGQVWAQADRWHSPERWRHPRGLMESLRLVTFRGVPPPELELVVGVYRQGGSGVQRLPVTVARQEDAAPIATGADVARVARLGTDGWRPPEFEAGPPGATPAGVPFGRAMLLESWSITQSDGQLVVDLTWISGRAYASDYTVSVQAEGRSWAAQHDGTPALGTFPTLKWLPGLRLPDRHRIDLDAGADLEAGYVVHVSVYDAFTQEPLPVTDRERVAAGQGQRALIFDSRPSPRQ